MFTIRRTPTRGAAAALSALLVLALAPVARPASAAAAEIEYVGRIQEPPSVKFGDRVVAKIDPVNRRLYYFYRDDSRGYDWYAVEYDLAPDVPVALREGRLAGSTELTGFKTDNNTALDSSRQRLAVISVKQADGTAAAVNDGARLSLVDLSELSLETSWLLAERGLAGFWPSGVTYSATDDRYYLVGEWIGNQASNALYHHTLGTPAGPLPTVVALDGEDGSVAWVRPLAQCQQPLDTFGVGTRIVRSATRESIYVFCHSGGSAAVAAYPGQSGLVRLDIAPEAGMGDAVRFPVSFFPISGSFPLGSGLATYDSATDRMFVQSASAATPGAFVFDGRLESWVGFIASDDERVDAVAFHEGLGHMYMGAYVGGSRYLVIADGRQTPPSQGVVIHSIAPVRYMLPDPVTDRLIMQESTADGAVWSVYRDRVPPSRGLPAIDWDSLTADVPEGDDTSATFIGGVTGFGSLTRLVGGVESAASYRGPAEPPPAVSSAFAALPEEDRPNVDDPVVVSFGDRSLVAGDVPGLYIAGFGSGAAARAVSTDSSTANDLGGASALAGDGNASSSEESDGGSSDDEVDTLAWPYAMAECSDGGEGTSTSYEADQATTGRAETSCDFEGGVTRARSAHSGAVRTPDWDFTVVESSFDGESARSVDGGVMSVARAFAHGVTLTVPDAGSAVFGSVTASTNVRARGRTGTAAARYVRRIEGVVLVDGSGSRVDGGSADGMSCVSVYTTTDDDEIREIGSCRALIDAVNAHLQQKVKVRLPVPELAATPRGAFAEVRESEADFLRGQTVLGDSSRAMPAVEVTYFNDGSEKSRLLVHLAAVTANSKYAITRFGTGAAQTQDRGWDDPLADPFQGRLDGADGVPQIRPSVPGEGSDLSGLVSALGGWLEQVGTFGPDTAAASGEGSVIPKPDNDADADAPGEQFAPYDPGPVQSNDEPVSAWSGDLSPGTSEGATSLPADAPDVAASEATRSQDPGSAPTQQLGGSALLARSTGDAALVAGLWLMFGGAIVLSIRRRLLGQLVNG